MSEVQETDTGRRRRLVVVGTAVLAVAVAALFVLWWVRAHPRVPTINPVDYGAVGDGRTDDSAALQRAFNSVPEGGTVTLPGGRVFAHSKVLTFARRNARLTGGGTLLATNEATSEVLVRADGVRVDNITLAISNTTKRWSAYEQMKLRIGPSTGVVVSDVNITGSAASGVFVGGATNFQLIRMRVSNTRADGIHMTEGSRQGKVIDANVTGTGDDGVAVISYKDFPICSFITVTGSRVTAQKWGRAFSVVGGQDITMSNLYAENSSSAAIYISSEANYNTWPISRVSVTGATLVRSNQNTGVDQGAVMLYNGQPGTTDRDIRMTGISITDTRRTASWNVAILNGTNAAHAGVVLDRFTITDGPARRCYSNASTSSYRLSGWVVDGRPWTATSCPR